MHRFLIQQIPHHQQQHVSLINLLYEDKNIKNLNFDVFISLALFDDILQSSTPTKTTSTSPTKNFFSGNFIKFIFF
jgi:hypothetical protein